MNPNARISALETKFQALLAVIEKQNETLASLEQRLGHVEKLPQPAGQTSAEYKPLFDRWPGNGR
jgi:prefoldin subunit 5